MHWLSLLAAAVLKAYSLSLQMFFLGRLKYHLTITMPLVCFVLFCFFPQTYLNLFIQRNVVTFKIITPSGSMFISYKSIFLLLSTSFKNLFNLFNNSTLKQKKGTLKKQMFTFTPKFLHNLKYFPITFLSLLDYNFYNEVLMKAILSQLDCTIY